MYRLTAATRGQTGHPGTEQGGRGLRGKGGTSNRGGGLVRPCRAELGPGLELVAAVTQHLNVAVYILATEGQRAHMVHVHPSAGKSPKHQSHHAEPRSCTRRRSRAAASRRFARRLPRARRVRTVARPSYVVWCVLQRPRCVAGSVQSMQRMCVPLVVLVVVIACPPPESNRGTLRIAYGSPRGGRYRAPLPLGQRACVVLAGEAVRTWGLHALTTPFGAPVKGGYSWAVQSPRSVA